jgi:hypothetical protein
MDLALFVDAFVARVLVPIRIPLAGVEDLDLMPMHDVDGMTGGCTLIRVFVPPELVQTDPGGREGWVRATDDDNPFPGIAFESIDELLDPSGGADKVTRVEFVRMNTWQLGEGLLAARGQDDVSRVDLKVGFVVQVRGDDSPEGLSLQLALLQLDDLSGAEAGAVGAVGIKEIQHDAADFHEELSDLIQRGCGSTVLKKTLS